MTTLSKAQPKFFSDTDNSAPGQLIGLWHPAKAGNASTFESIDSALHNLDRQIYLLEQQGKTSFVAGGYASFGLSDSDLDGIPIKAILPAIKLQNLGHPDFCTDHGLALPYMAGAMANGIASTRLVKAIANAGMLGSFGAAGLTLDKIEEAVIDLKQSLQEKPFCSNLIYSPNEKGHEDAVVDLYLRHRVQLVEASAYMALTLAVVRYRTAGIHTDQHGNIVTPNRIIAKASRIEVATRWFSPPPDKFLADLVARGDLTEAQVELARQIPMAQDLTVEADSGGHTDNRPAITLVPTIIALRDRLQTQYNYAVPLRVGAAGGIATPASAAAAFAMGAAYIVTGTVNQACIESGSSDIARRMLAAAEQADVAMAPAVDMFEMGVKLQVLKRGTMFAMRGNKLYELYRVYDCIDDIPQTERESLEKTLFKAPLADIWQQTRVFFLERDPAEIDKAEQDKKHKMALMFRWYLGLSSRWANAGVAERQVDYQIWCGPAMGAFNEWSRGTWLEQPENRGVVNVALNLMYGAALVTRINQLRNQGINIASEVKIEPLQTSDIERYLK